MSNAMLSRMLVAVACTLVVTLAASNGALAASGTGLLGDTHKAKAIECASCHDESPPAKAVGTAKCQQCHGGFKTLAAKTERNEPNPHASHQGDTDCAQCHHMHKASDDLCAKCHVTNWRVP